MNPFTNTGKTFDFLGRKYTRGKSVKLQIGDEVIIHPVPCGPDDPYSLTGFKSQAIKSYSAQIIAKEIPWVKMPHTFPEPMITEHKIELCLVGIRENKGWNGGGGAVLNDWGFNRLEFVKRQSTLSSVVELLTGNVYTI